MPSHMAFRGRLITTACMYHLTFEHVSTNVKHVSTFHHAAYCTCTLAVQIPMKNIITLLGKWTPKTAEVPPDPTTVAGKNVNDVLKILRSGRRDPKTTPIVIDHGSSRLNYAVGYSPCITASRGKAGGHWAVWKSSRLTMQDMMLLMGVQPSRVAGWETVISKPQMGFIIGNAIPMPLLARILCRLLVSAGLVRVLPDPFIQGPSPRC